MAKAAARRTQRLRLGLRDIGLADGGERGARLARRLGMRTSPDSLLRLIREGKVCDGPNPKVVGVDEWAKRKGQTYGTIIVDLERRRVVDLLEDASAEGFAAWLKEHPGVEVISRDRGGAFAEGGREGAPEAIQVADRFHILKNLGEAIEEYLGRIRRQLPRKPRSPKDPVSPSLAVMSSASSPDSRRLLRLEQDRQHRRGRRLERYNAVIALHRKGVSARQIAQSLDLDRGTVRKYINADAFPERAPHAKRPSLLDPFRAYLQRRWDDGCHNSRQLFRELKERGFAGQRAIVADVVARMRRQRLPDDSVGIREVVEKAVNRRMSPRTVRWWFQGKREELEGEHRALLDQFLADHDETRNVYDLTQRFGTMVRERRAADLDGWLHEARHGPRELKSFVKGIVRDRKAVEAALTHEWSQGQTEGQINRVKLTKRAMFGRSNFDLLRRRVLEAV